jgi:hypothetical protein
MVVDDEGLKSIYRAYVHSNTPASREKCPPTECMIRLLRGRGSKREKTRLVDHISRCGYCAEEFEFLVEARRSENELIQGVGRWLGRKERERLRPPLFSRFSWGLASLVAAFAVAGVLLLKFVILPVPETYRADSHATIELLEPVDIRVSRPNLVFRWRTLPAAEYYVLGIFDETLAPVWESARLTADQAALPREIIRKLGAGKTYFWLVTAHLPGREQVHSSLAEFILRE